MAKNLFTQIMLSVEGIQAYLFSTGKLKEMIGASELTSSFADYALAYCTDKLKLKEVSAPNDLADWFVILQKGAGTLRLLLPNKDLAKSLLNHMSHLAVEQYVGFPLFGAMLECSDSSTEINAKRTALSEIIAQKRATQALPGRKVWPFVKIAPLDGLPAVEQDEDKKWISIESLGRRKPKLLKQAREKFEKEVRASLADEPLMQGLEPVPVDDIDEMLKESRVQKIALLHMDGNDLGNLFRAAAEKVQNKSFAEQNSTMRALSNLVDTANHYAFSQAMRAIIHKDLEKKLEDEEVISPRYIVPARPLVLAGDDLTIIIRADLAFNFADTYAKSFQDYTKEQGTPMSVGGGMVIMPNGYPFTQAFLMAEDLTSNAKKFTTGKKNAAGVRPSSIDYLVITNDVDDQLDTLRKTTFTAKDGSYLTGKPFICGVEPQAWSLDAKAYQPDASLADVLKDAILLEKLLPAAQLRGAIEKCREGRASAQRAWQKLWENLVRGIGGHDKNAKASFERIFNQGNFFFARQITPKEKQYVTLLGDYLEVRRLFFPIKEEIDRWRQA